MGCECDGKGNKGKKKGIEMEEVRDEHNEIFIYLIPFEVNLRYINKLY